jgi:hypothetical protein
MILLLHRPSEAKRMKTTPDNIRKGEGRGKRRDEG